jgi:hypothetical protein
MHVPLDLHATVPAFFYPRHNHCVPVLFLSVPFRDAFLVRASSIKTRNQGCDALD